MPDTHTIAEVAADEMLLRRLAGEVLNPGPHEHFFVVGFGSMDQPYCHYCEKEESEANEGDACPAARMASGSLPDIAEALTEKACHIERELGLYFAIRDYIREHESYQTEYWRRFATAPAALRSAICLAAIMPGRVKT